MQCVSIQQELFTVVNGVEFESVTVVYGVGFEAIQLKQSAVDGHVADEVEGLHGAHGHPLLLLRQLARLTPGYRYVK